jgi:hemerythrin-like domain-containing protein
MRVVDPGGAAGRRFGQRKPAHATSREPVMQATDILSTEHRTIELVIAAMTAAADRLEAGGRVRPGFFVDAARFLRDFADGYHHAKEEGVLFAAMARNGMPMDDGPIGVMLDEHERGRALTAGLRESALRLAGGDDRAAERVVDFARAYGELLTQHIGKEDHILFRMADQVLPPQDQDEVLDAFAGVEDAQAARGSKASYLELAASLAREMAIDPQAATPREFVLPCHAR